MVVRGEGPSEFGRGPGADRRARRTRRAFLGALVWMALAWLPASAQAPDSAGGGTAADQDPVRAFGAANRLYEAGRFSEAAQAYQAIVDRGFESASLYFNLGNA